MTSQFLPKMHLVWRAIVSTWPILVATTILGLLTINAVYSAPEPPGLSELWRWSTIIVAFGLMFWNVRSAYRAYRSSGFLSMVGFLHAWCFLAFSFPSFEATYRYPSIKLLYWEAATNTPMALAAVLMLGVFQLLFFLALGREPGEAVRRITVSAKAERPNRWLALVFLMLVLPLLASRLDVIFDLGLRGMIETMITREPYTNRLDGEQNPILLLLGTLFPVYATPLFCLIAKYAVRHPSVPGGLLYMCALFAGAFGVFFTGGRGELIYVLFVVLIFAYVQGYAKLGRYKLIVIPLLAVPVLLVGLVFFLVAQARHGADNFLSNLAEDTFVGYDYSAGDVTQALGLGRFDAVLMSLDNYRTETLLWGKSYAYAVLEGINETLIPRVLLGKFLPEWRISDQVMGPWIFGEIKASGLPSMPGELFLNFGFIGVTLGALVMGFLTRLLLLWLVRFDGAVEFAWIMLVWTTARLISDESFLMAGYAARHTIPVLLITFLLVKRRKRPGREQGNAASNEKGTIAGFPPSRIRTLEYGER